MLEDLRRGRLTQDEAESLYGIVIDESGGAVDLERTTERRVARRAERVARARPPRRPAPSAATGEASPQDGQRSSAAKIIEGVAILGSGVARRFACARCDQGLGVATQSYRHGCCELDLPLGEVSRHFLSPVDEVGEALCFRRFLCPGCGTVIDSQICRPQDAPFEDVELLDA